MHCKKTWIAAVFSLACLIHPAFSQDQYIDPELLDIKKIREQEKLSENYNFTRLYVFLAVKKNQEYEAFVTRNDQDLDNDKKSVLEEPNDLDEYQKLTTFNNELIIEKDKHICYITALPHYDTLFPNTADPFSGNGIVEISTRTKSDNIKCLEGSKTLPLLDSLTGKTIGIERYVAFYNKAVNTVEITKTTKDSEGKDVEEKTGEVKEIIGPQIGSYGFIFMQLEESGK